MIDNNVNETHLVLEIKKKWAEFLKQALSKQYSELEKTVALTSDRTLVALHSWIHNCQSE